jgi:hypothetical protein
LVFKGRQTVLRISTNNDSANYTLTLEGWLAGPWVDELRKEIKLVLDQGTPVKLDLEKLWFTDTSGVVLLRELTKLHVTFVRCSTFIRQQLKESM